MSNETIKPRIYDRSADPTESDLKPIVINYQARMKMKKKGQEDKGGNKYSRGLKDVQQAETDFLRFARRASKAVSKGLDTYDRERARSASEKTDGAIEDMARNSAKAIGVSLKEASDIPLDIADSISSKNTRKRLRRSLQRATKSLRVFRL